MSETMTGTGRVWSVRNGIHLLFSLAVTAGIFAYLLTHVSIGAVLDLLRNVDRRAVAMFLVLSLGQSVFRLWRYHVILRLAGHNPGSFALFLVVLVRNLFSDLLPARMGTLVFIYLANSRLGVPFAAATSGFSLSFIFDLIALAPLLVLAAAGAGAVGNFSPTAMLLAGGVFTVAMVAVLFLLPQLFRGAGRLLAVLPVLPRRQRAAWAAAVGGVADEIRRAQSAGVYVRLLALSVLVRVAKYGPLYVFLYALLAPIGYTWAQLPVARVFLGLCAAELAASLPISGIAGFGVYEGAWALVFQMLGFPGKIAKLTSISHHLFTQVYGYGLGAAALLVLLLPFWKTDRAPAAGTAVRYRPAVFYGRLAALTALIVALLFGLNRLPASSGRHVAAAERPGAEQAAALREFAAEAPGRIVFDSNRSGTFGIWIMNTDGSGVRVVSDTPEHEMYPDPSPDGSAIVFARLPSLSKQAAGEIWVCGPDGSGAHKLADNGTFPTFSADGRTVYFERERRRIMAIGADGQGERQIFPVGRAPFGGETVKPRVSADGRFVVFTSNRGEHGGYNTWYADLETGKPVRVSLGCEPGWFPDGKRIAWVRESGGRERTGIFQFELAGGRVAELQDADAPRGHEYFPVVSRDGRFLTWGACRPGEHDHTDSNYQLFVRALPDGRPVRLTFDGFDNRWAKLVPGS